MSKRSTNRIPLPPSYIAIILDKGKKIDEFIDEFYRRFVALIVQTYMCYKPSLMFHVSSIW